uniref:Protein TEX261 n=1 Tax=Chrysotila carterae TaxID=13221 RepID=A0A7S4F6P2_CHRCT|mmetsp:Transcript_53882/g.117563  ORF Transcript_53882/g.117563 Transcript_53882/m.117563 type:complete len:200 (+) Transcript_53882:2-601(+)
MGLVITGLVYAGGYLFLLFIAICLACGLYYLAELAEEYTVLTGRLISLATMAVLVVHALMLMFEPQLPRTALAVGALTHVCYLWLMRSFPFLRIASVSFLASLVLLAASHYAWAMHFLYHFHQVTHVLCFFLCCVWLVPFGFFISLSINESTLPDVQAASASEVYSEGSRSRQKSGIVSAFSFMQQKRDDMMPSFAKKV